MKASGQLLYGIPHGDVIHYDYTVAVPVIRHTIAALAATTEAMGESDSPAASMYYRAALMAEVIESLGDLPKEAITAELLLDGLTDEDMDLLDAELSGLKKSGCAYRRSLRAPTSHPHPRTIRHQRRPHRRNDCQRADQLAG